VKVGMESLNLMPFRACQFNENWRHKNRSLFGIVNEIFYIFLPILVNLRAEDVHDNLLGFW
jgi:hypothetical protein